VAKTAAGHADRIIVCIGCNQACLDHIFSRKTVTCLVNPWAGNETRMATGEAEVSRHVAVIGAGPGGLAAAVTAAGRGHTVTLFEAADRIGGQLNHARVVPGKAEFDETIRYYDGELERLGVDVRLDSEVTASAVVEGGFDAVVLATGVVPRTPPIPGIDHDKVLGYGDVLGGGAEVGERVAVIGAGGIGFDVAEHLTHDPAVKDDDLDAYLRTWGIDKAMEHPGGLLPGGREPHASGREVWLMQRSEGKLGDGLGRTTGWIHRATLKMRGVHMLAGMTYDRIDDRGLHVTLGGRSQVLDADHVVICAGQESRRDLEAPLREAGVAVHVIGGAKKAGEIDAKRAIAEGTKAALAI